MPRVSNMRQLTVLLASQKWSKITTKLWWRVQVLGFPINRTF
jgi:hypothetical protein